MDIFSKEELLEFQEKLNISPEVLAILIEAIAIKVDQVKNEVTQELTEKAEAYAEYVKEEVTQELTEKAEAYAEYVKEEITNKVSEYTDYAMNEYVKQNSDKFTKLELFERMESAFHQVKSAFEHNGFTLTENALALELQEELRQAEQSFETVFEELQATKKKLEESEMALFFEANTRDLAETEKERLKSLSEKVNFDGLDEFKTGVQMLIEQVKIRPEAEKEPELAPKETSKSSTIDAVLKHLRGFS